MFHGKFEKIIVQKSAYTVYVYVCIDFSDRFSCIPEFDKVGQ